MIWKIAKFSYQCWAQASKCFDWPCCRKQADIWKIHYCRRWHREEPESLYHPCTLVDINLIKFVIVLLHKITSLVFVNGFINRYVLCICVICICVYVYVCVNWRSWKSRCFKFSLKNPFSGEVLLNCNYVVQLWVMKFLIVNFQNYLPKWNW